ncbi:head GIN domain-containing protein [Hymenobacter persicinus]|uniref:head GIN domain-containing protein n=1 Tax=Hymenobacter persicinus TaxID=2025506 RepID=UPI00374319A1
MFLEDLFRNLRPLLNFIGSAIRIFAGAMLILIGLSLLVGFTIALAAGLGWIPESQNIVMGDVPVHILIRDLPGWSILAFYMAAIIPAISMLLSGLGLLLRRTVLTRTVGLSLFGLWLLSVIGCIFSVARISHNFQNEGQQVQQQSFPGLSATPTLFLDTRHVDRSNDQDVEIEFVPADSGAVVSVDKTFSAKGATEAEGARTAATSMGYTVRQANDTTLVFDDHFSFLPEASYRDQNLRLTVHLPRNKTFRLSEDFSYWMNSANFVNDQRPEKPENHLFRLRNNQLECVDCSAEDLRGDDFGDEYDEDTDTTDEVVNIHTDEGNMRVRVNTDNDNVGVSFDIPKSNFSANPAEYGSGRRTFNLSGFRQIEASGAYRVYVRQGSAFKVEAAGTDSDLRNLRVDTNGDQLTIHSLRSSFFGNFTSNRKPILVRVELPELRYLELNGACRANVAGFRGQPLKVEQSGACNAALAVDVPQLTLDLSGACQTDLRGSATELKVEGTGVCQINALELKSQRAEVELSGMSKAKVNVTDRLRADLSGASRLGYAGKPTSVRKEVSGSSRVTSLVD